MELHSPDLHDRITSILLTLWASPGREDARAWALAVALGYIVAQKPGGVDLSAAWKLLEEEYTAHIKQRFPQEKDLAGSFKDAGEEAWAGFLVDYVNRSPSLRHEGVQGVKLTAEGLKSLASSAPKGVAAPGIGILGLASGGPRLFGVLLPIVGLGSGLRPRETQSQALRDKGLWTGLAALDLEGSLATGGRLTPSGRRLAAGAFSAAYVAGEFPAGGALKPLPGTSSAEGSPLAADLLASWEQRRQPPPEAH
ncbi:MAG: hypothetical protein HY687_06355 [Chloroflexi bacterium]|nr:hypothetical protein [Chloroflexota bacterium]